MEQAEAEEPHVPAAAASQCYCWVQNSFLWCRKALVRGGYEVLYRQHMCTFLLGMGSGIPGQLLSQVVNATCKRTVLMW